MTEVELGCPVPQLTCIWMQVGWGTRQSLSCLPGAGWTIQPLASILRLDLPDPGTSMNTGEESQVLVSRWRPKPRCRVTW